MNSLQNLVSWRSNISVSLTSKRKLQGQANPQGPLATMTASATILNKYRTSNQMATGHQRIGRRIFGPPPQERNARTSDQRFTQYNQRGGPPNRGCGRGRSPYKFKPLCCMFHGSKNNHRTKDCPIFLESKRKIDQESNPPSQQIALGEVNHTMQWAPHHQQYSSSYPLHFPPQANQNNQAHALAYCQSYHYATTNHPQPWPTPQITYPPTVPQITYSMPNNTNPHVKTEAYPPPPHLPQIHEPPQQPNTFPTRGTILTITGVPTPILIPRDSANCYG
jgi:hypothetical protein